MSDKIKKEVQKILVFDFIRGLRIINVRFQELRILI